MCVFVQVKLIGEIMNKNIIETREAVQDWFESQSIKCFYSGIRADVAFVIGVAPNNPVFNWVFDNLDFIQNGDGSISAL